MLGDEMKEKIGFWKWFFKKFYTIIKEIWSEGGTVRIFVLTAAFWWATICVLLMVYHPSDAWLRCNNTLLGLSVVIPIIIVSISGLYGWYQMDNIVKR